MSLSTTRLKRSLILLTLISVVCDSMILPFYPQFFSQAFGVTDPKHTGYYIASCCLTVMLAFPLWAKIAQRVNELHLWVYTQIASALLGLSCFYAQDLLSFWILSQLMLVFKASYLLIYPFVMRLEEKDSHLNMVGLFSVLMHFGAIGGALLGGFTLNFSSPRDLYLIMVAGDLLQVIVCLFLISSLSIAWYRQSEGASDTTDEQSNIEATQLTFAKRLKSIVPSYLIKLSIVSLLFYFAAFSLRPFLSLYWEQISEFDSEIVSGFVYSIPGWVALVGLWLNFKFNSRLNLHQRILVAFGWTLLASFIQSSTNDWVLVLGRIIYGWGLFQGMVCLEVLLFKISEPKHYARDFSRIHWFQNFGVILASFSSGYLVAEQNLRWPFFAAAVLFAITLVTFVICYKRQVFGKEPDIPSGQRQVA